MKEKQRDLEVYIICTNNKKGILKHHTMKIKPKNILIVYQYHVDAAKIRTSEKTHIECMETSEIPHVITYYTIQLMMHRHVQTKQILKGSRLDTKVQIRRHNFFQFTSRLSNQCSFILRMEKTCQLVS